MSESSLNAKLEAAMNIPDQGALKKIEDAIDFKFGEEWTPERRNRLGENQIILIDDKENRPFAKVTLDKFKWEDKASAASNIFNISPKETRDIQIQATRHFSEDGKDKVIEYSIDLEEQVWKSDVKVIVKGGYVKKGIPFDVSSNEEESKTPLEALQLVDQIIEIANYINKK